MQGRPKISAFVVAYNRAPILGTCLRALHFADELIVVDKSSTDDTVAVATRLATSVVTVPWTPTVEETRVHALSLCAHDWILFLDDDECLNPVATTFIQEQVRRPRADIYAFPLRHYIIGLHDEAAYYWPEHHVRLFRRGSVRFTGTVHGGIHPVSDRLMHIPVETGACIHHLSHPDVAGWIERTNRYTSRPDRAGPDQVNMGEAARDLAGFAHARIDHWMARTKTSTADGYPEAVAVLRAIYDMVDLLKGWEQARGLDGPALFARACARLDAEHAAYARRAWPQRVRDRWPRTLLGRIVRRLSRRVCRRRPG